MEDFKMADYSKYQDASWLTNNNWGKWGPDDEIGVLNDVTPADVVKAVSLIKTGKVYDLETIRFHGMPVWDGHCGFELMTYASPKGRRNMTKQNAYPAAYSWHGEGGWIDSSKDDYQIDANTEMLIAPLHCGTHIDGFGHITSPGRSWCSSKRRRALRGSVLRGGAQHRRKRAGS